MNEETPSAREQSLALSTSPEWPSCLAAAEIRYRLKWARSQNRFWYYDRASRQPLADETAWRSSRWPWFGGDEYGRKTIVIPIPFHGELVFAFWTWTGEEDHAMREQTWHWEREEAEEARKGIAKTESVRLRTLDEVRASRVSLNLHTSSVDSGHERE